MKKTFVLAILGTILLGNIMGCYKNRYDISDHTLESIRTISLRKDVAPIVTSGGCGCHNISGTSFVFSLKDTIYYETIIGKASIMNNMANGGVHPGEGSIRFTPSQAEIIKKWVAQGAKDDGEPAPITDDVSYAKHIVPVIKQSCSGGTCHGGLGPVLDFTLLKANEAKLRTMMNSQGTSGHTPSITVSQTTATLILGWINGGFKD